MNTNTTKKTPKVKVCPTPKDIKTRTQLTIDELKPEGGKATAPDEVSEKAVEEANLINNPDFDSMESRG